MFSIFFQVLKMYCLDCPTRMAKGFSHVYILITLIALIIYGSWFLKQLNSHITHTMTTNRL
jgi:flagellar biogenesis protein FliO